MMLVALLAARARQKQRAQPLQMMRGRTRHERRREVMGRASRRLQSRKSVRDDEVAAASLARRWVGMGTLV
jgi:hypothetical protein